MTALVSSSPQDFHKEATRGSAGSSGHCCPQSVGKASLPQRAASEVPGRGKMKEKEEEEQVRILYACSPTGRVEVRGGGSISREMAGL